MGAFGGLILTNKGRNLQAKAQTGVQLNFTKIKIGDGSLSGQSIVDLTDLISTKKELTILGLQTLSGGKAKLRSYLSNADITTGFYWRELGIFAQDPDEGEVLYCYGNAGANAEYIPAGGGPDVIERYINVIALIGNASNISATLGSEIYVTQADFNSHKEAATLDHPDNSVTDQKIGVRSADPSLVPASNGPGKITEWISWLANRIKAITGKTNWYDAPDITLATLAAHKTRHATGGADALAPGDIGAASAADLAAHLAEIVTTPQANKILRLDANAKLPASITGDAATVAGKSVGNGSGQVPVSNGTVCTNLNSDRVDSIHFRVSNGVLQYSTDGSVWNSVSVIKSIQRGVVESTALGDINVTINNVDTSKAIVITSGDGYGYGTYTVIHSFRYAVLTNSTTLTIKQRFYQSSWGNNSYVSMAWQVVEFY